MRFFLNEASKGFLMGFFLFLAGGTNDKRGGSKGRGRRGRVIKQ